MDKNTVQSVVEALLFASGDAMELKELADIIDINPEILNNIILELSDKLNYEKRGIKIIKLGTKFQMCTRGEYYEYIQKIVPPQKKMPLSKASIETLSIVAYKQPVTRSQISHIRGVDSDNSVNRLIELGLIEVVGKLDAPGRPSLLSTTDEFLRQFGLSSLEELEPLDSFEIDNLLKESD
ncbi:MAG: SMC-Scp complex subunit ScpB [Clostridia bacterium]|nr:SMC-Scp complex subunit ScpB [Clostridia bacterium]MBQ4542692.1 SMC-Scp complex subunit ScpB [Clostridia bacterium]